jgi:hypothetical protein
MHEIVILSEAKDLSIVILSEAKDLRFQPASPDHLSHV